MVSVFTGDILPLDIGIKIPNYSRFTGTVKRWGLPEDGKESIGEKLSQLISQTYFPTGDYKRPSQELVDLTEGHPVSIHPGGSSANTIETYLKATRSQGMFFGVTGNDEAGDRIRRSLRQAKLTLVPERLRQSADVVSARSFSFQHSGDDGKEYTSYAVFRGNAKQLLRPEDVTPAMIAEVKAVFLPASMHGGKMDVEIFYRILQLRWAFDKEFWFSPHTSEESARNEGTAAYFQGLIRSANRITSNVREMSWMLLPHIETKDISVDQTLHELKKVFAERFLEKSGRARDSEPIGLVTHDKNGAYAVTADNIIHVPVGRISAKYSIGGGGDASAAGALAGLDVGLSPYNAVRVGQEFSAAKIETTYGPRLEGDPLEDHLHPRNPVLAELFRDGLQERISVYGSHGHRFQEMRVGAG